MLIRFVVAPVLMKALMDAFFCHHSLCLSILFMICIIYFSGSDSCQPEGNGLGVVCKKLYWQINKGELIRLSCARTLKFVLEQICFSRLAFYAVCKLLTVQAHSPVPIVWKLLMCLCGGGVAHFGNVDIVAEGLVKQ